MKTKSLFIGPVVVALLGLTVLDDSASVPMRGEAIHRPADPDSIDCLVANPSFHGVGSIPLALH